MLLALLRSLGRRWSRRRPAKVAPRPRPALRVEPLEDRWVPSVIGGTVYNDANTDGLMQPGEAGIAGNTIELHDGTGNLLASAVTDANGHYQFATNPTVTPHPATQEVDADFAQAKTDWAQDQAIAQFDPSLGHLDSVEIINSATMNSDIQVKSLNPMASTVGGTVKGTVTLTAGNSSPLAVNLASNEQAPVEASDSQMAFSGPGYHDFGAQTASDSATVTLEAGQQDLSAFIGTGTVAVHESASAVWQGSGSATLLTLVDTQAAAHVRVIYHYTTTNDLAPGSYTLVQPQVPPGFVMGRDTADNVTPLPPNGPPATIPVTLTANGSLNNNFGELLPGSLGGFVYNDVHGSGVRTPDDPGIPGTTITLAGTALTGQVLNQATQTDATGAYVFNNLPPGDYVLTETQPAGYLQGSNQVGSLGGSQSGDQFLVHLTGGNGTDYNFGEVLPPPPPPPPVQAPDLPAPPPPAPPAQQQGPGALVTDVAPPSKRDFLGNNWLMWM